MPTIDVPSGAAGHQGPERASDRPALDRVLRRRRRLRRRSCVVLTIVAAAATPGGALAAGSASTARAASAAPSTATIASAGVSRSTLRAVQRRLGIRADGIYGPQTRRAVRRFQRRHRLVVDGIVGPATLRALGLSSRRAREAKTRTAVSPVLRRIARCESGGNPRAISPGGRYRGKYQFDLATWRALGGKGDPARASEAEQDRRAAALLRRRGTAPWANCA